MSDDAEKRRYPSREGKRAATVYLEMLVYRQLRVLAALTDATLQDIVIEAIDEYLERRNGAPSGQPAEPGRSNEILGKVLNNLSDLGEDGPADRRTRR